MIINKDPLVSILLCSYNAERFILSTINSLINQKYDNIEILILDNNSQDNTCGILKKLEKNNSKIKLFTSKKNLGPYGGLNFLLDKATGEYVSIADHDDIYHPNKIQIQVDFLLKNKKYIGCGTTLYKYFEKNKQFKYIKVYKKGDFSAHPSLLFRNKKKLKYNLDVKYKVDTFFMKYILCHKKPLLFNIQKPLYLSRVREDNNNLSYLWNKNLSFSDIYNYYDFTKDKKQFIKLVFKKILRYNLFLKFTYLFGRKKLDFFKNDKFFKKYLIYLKD